MRWFYMFMLFSLMITCSICAWCQGEAPQAADDWTGTDEQKIAGLATIWAEAKYAFPSFEQLPDLDWGQSFQDFIPRVVAAKDKDEYYWTLMEFAGLLQDGHTSVLPPWMYLRPGYDNPPLEVQIVEGAFMIARAGETPELTAEGIHVGLEILEIDGVEARTYFEDSVNRYYPRGSAHANDAVNIVYLLRGPRDSKVTLKLVDSAGVEREVTLTRNSMLPTGGPFLPRVLLWMLADSSIEIENLSEDVQYIRIANFEDPAMADEFLGMVDGMDKDGTTGLLIDMRFCLGGRGDISETMIGALIDSSVSSPHWKYPHYVAAHRNWGREPEWSTAKHIIPPRDGARFMGPIVILTAGTASSTAEDFAISLREAGRAVLVGERTAGSAGNPISRPLPGGGQFRMATFRAYLPDGGEYVGIGVKPDIEIAPSKQDIRSDADIVMDKGLEVLADWETYGR
ncbi:S41 family peptidase [Candidatus Eisenbacteria bacterium]|uniref:S41 family peptidase n=1 Tax=Eiseniibacteriota bacterium TaxID=2212470 RepID=A0ABV6YPL7_UNCEI